MPLLLLIVAFSRPPLFFHPLCSCKTLQSASPEALALGSWCDFFSLTNLLTLISFLGDLVQLLVSAARKFSCSFYVSCLEMVETSLPIFSKNGSQSVPLQVVSLPTGDIWQDAGEGLAQRKAAWQTWPWQCHQAKYIRGKPWSYTALLNPESLCQIFRRELPQALF